MYARMNGGFEALLGKRVMIMGSSGTNWCSKTHPYESVMSKNAGEKDIFTMGQQAGKVYFLTSDGHALSAVDVEGHYLERRNTKEEPESRRRVFNEQELFEPVKAQS